MTAARVVRATLAACGAALFAYLILAIGPAAVAASLRQLSWRIGIILVFPSVLVVMFDTLGWRFAYARDCASLLTMARARVAGQAVNATTPTGTLGGDAVKAWLLREHASVRESLAAAIIVKTTMPASQGIFLLGGILMAWRTLPPDLPLVHAMKWLLALEVVGVGGFVAVQLAGVLGRGDRLLARLGVGVGRSVTDACAHVDDALATFYRRQPRRLLLSVGYNLL